MDETDLRLWTAWIDRRDDVAFGTVVRPHLVFLRDFAGRIAVDPADADDAVQQALTRLAMERSRRPVEVGLRAWLGRTLRLEVRMLARARGRRRRHEAAARSREIASPGDASGPHQEVMRALEQLPEAQRGAIVLHFLHDLDYVEMSAVLGASESACRVRVHRGIERLRRRLGAGAAALVASLPFLRSRASEAAIPAATSAAVSGATLPPLVGDIAVNKLASMVLGGLIVAGGAVAFVTSRGEREPAAPVEGAALAHSSEPSGDELRRNPIVAAPPPAPVETATTATPPRTAQERLSDLVTEVLAAGGTVRARGGSDVKSAAEIGGREITGLDAKSGAPVTWLVRIGDAPTLEDLDISTTPTRDEEVAALPPLAGLKTISLSGTAITGTALARLPQAFPALKTISLQRLKALGSGLASLEQLPALSELYLNGSLVSDADLVYVGRLARLLQLHLDETQITDAGLVALRGLVSLKKIWLRKTGLTGRGFAHLEGLAALEDVALGTTKIDDLGLASLARLPRLTEVGLQKTEVTDAGLAHLRGHSSLEQLGLDATRVTDAGLVHLERVPKLRNLSLGKTSVTDAGVDRLKTALPQLRISR